MTGTEELENEILDILWMDRGCKPLDCGTTATLFPKLKRKWNVEDRVSSDSQQEELQNKKWNVLNKTG